MGKLRRNFKKLLTFANSCDKPTQDAAGRLTYADLVTTKQGRDVARALLNAVINQQLSYQISVRLRFLSNHSTETFLA